MSTSERSNLVGPIVRRFRKGNDWTQKELARLLRELGWKKCDRAWISRLESGGVILRDIEVPCLQAVLGDDFGAAVAERTTKAAHAKLAGRSVKGSAISIMGLFPALLALV